MKSLLLLLKGAKLGKVLLTVGSMAVSIVVYGYLYGWGYGIGFVVLLLVHEMGHFVAARQKGLNVGAPTFIPFVGAWINLKDQPRNAETEAYVGIAGPVAGTLGALACYYLSREESSRMLLAVSYSGFFLNLFNLIPLSPLDGGRVTSVISPKLWFVGVPVLVAMFFYHPSPLLLMIALLAWPQLQAAWRGKSPGPADYYIASAETRLTYSLLYLGLAVFLAVMASDVHVELSGQAS